MEMLPFSRWYTGPDFINWATNNGQPVSNSGTAEMIWIDLEMTGLDPVADPILEFGAILTDKFGNIIHGGVANWLVFDMTDRHYNYKIHNLDPYVRNMHEKSGLLHELAEAMRSPEVQLISRSRVEKAVVQWLAHFAYPGGIPENIKDRTPPSGSSVHFDRAALSFQMKNLNDAFHYRNGVDVSAWRYTMRMLAPSVAASIPEKREVHRPIPDLLDSIQLYRHMLGSFMKVELGQTVGANHA